MTDHDELQQRLLQIWDQAGRPSVRQLAQRAGFSHMTASTYLNGKIRNQQTLEKLVVALGGDVTWIPDAWLRAGKEPPAEKGRRRTVDVLEDMLRELRMIRLLLQRMNR